MANKEYRRFIAAITDTYEYNISDTVKCVICQDIHNPLTDAFNWLDGGLNCCKSTIHLSCLVEWRLTFRRTIDNQLIVSCPVCREIYLPAIWCFDRIGDALERFLLHEQYIENFSNINDERKKTMLSNHRQYAPRFLRDIKRRSTISKTIEQERKKLKHLATTCEKKEKNERDGLDMFIFNYVCSRSSTYHDIPPIDSNGNREIIDELIIFEKRLSSSTSSSSSSSSFPSISIASSSHSHKQKKRRLKIRGTFGFRIYK